MSLGLFKQAPVLERLSSNRVLKILHVFFLSVPLSISLGHFRAKSNVPLAFPMQFGSELQVHI